MPLRTRWDELTDAERYARDLRWAALNGGLVARGRAHHAERTLARMEMGDDIDD